MMGSARLAYASSPGDVLTVVPLPVDLVLWERTAKRKIGDGKGMGAEDMMRITFAHLKRTAQLPDTDMTFDQWLASLADWQPLSGDEQDPPQPVPEQS